jgi:hypothetical protein
MRKSGVLDTALCAAVIEMTRGLIDADLGGGVVKKRVSLPGRGKRGGARAIVATNKSDRWFFLHGFAKTERENVSAEELKALQKLAADYLGRSPADLNALVEEGAMQEICHDPQTESGKPDS